MKRARMGVLPGMKSAPAFNTTRLGNGKGELAAASVLHNPLALSHTYLAEGPDAAEVRILSARRATRKERLQYESGPR